LQSAPGALAEINAKRAAAGREGTTTLTVGGSIGSLADVERYRSANVDRDRPAPQDSQGDVQDMLTELVSKRMVV